jgi:hypothetical protein
VVKSPPMVAGASSVAPLPAQANKAGMQSIWPVGVDRCRGVLCQAAPGMKTRGHDALGRVTTPWKPGHTKRIDVPTGTAVALYLHGQIIM